MPPSFSVTGGRPLKGTIRPAGNKNAALPILAATLLADGPCRLDNVPHIRDVETMLELLAHLGATVTWTGPNSVDVDAARAEPRELDPALGARIRASILLAGPMLARFGRVSLPPPGGDVIGRRRVDTHFLALEQLGAAVTVGTTYQVEAKRLAGADIFLDEPSVTATENALMAAVAARGGHVPKLEDGPWPAFPADLMSIAIVVASQCEGLVLVFEKLFESRLFFVDKLIGMGARIVLCDPHRAVIAGPSPLRGGVVESPDIRAGMAMLLAALAAQGESVIHNIGQRERGYERSDDRQRALGGEIEGLEGQADQRSPG